MEVNDARIYARSEQGSPLRQGEIVSNLVQTKLELSTVGSDEPRVARETHQFAVVLSQDCDLEQDWEARRAASSAEGFGDNGPLPSILFAHVHDATALKAAVANDGDWRRAVKNKNERYQFLAAVRAEDDALGEGLPQLGIDFKRYFTIPTAEVYKRIAAEARRRCRLLSPYLEHLSIRFCYYQFRVALPVDHHELQSDRASRST
jgi:hypothetical protein